MFTKLKLNAMTHRKQAYGVTNATHTRYAHRAYTHTHGRTHPIRRRALLWPDTVTGVSQTEVLNDSRSHLPEL